MNDMLLSWPSWPETEPPTDAPTITMFLDDRTDYRMGTPRLRALPLQTIRRQFIPEWWEISRGIGNMLNEEGVCVYHYDIVRRKRASERTADTPRSILWFQT
jgi:hypothetical protein